MPHSVAPAASTRARSIGAGKKLRTWWPHIRRVLVIGVFVLVAVLITNRARTIDWDDVLESLRSYRVTTLLAAAALTLASQFFYSCFDLIGRAYTHHHISRPRVLAIAYASYAFNLNLGAWIGAIATRFRLYSRAGLGNAQITRILGMSWTTNWLGYLGLAGIVFLFVSVPPGWPAHPAPAVLRVAGALMLLVAAAYLLVCAFSRRRARRVRGHVIKLPSLRMALAQISLAVCHWLLMTSVIFVLLRDRVPFPTVLAVLLISAVAVIIVHIPAGLGVIEAVFLTLLSGAVAEGRVLAALLAYRAIYYLAPMVLGIATYFVLEAKAKRRLIPSRPPPPPLAGED